MKSKTIRTDWADRIAQLLLFLLFGAFLFWLSRNSTSPLIYPDESGYLGWARRIAGKAGDGLHYYPGFSVLLAPLFLWKDQLKDCYPLAIGVNVILGALIPVLLYRLSAVWCKREAVVPRFFLAVAAALYPAVTTYTQLALAENLLCVLLLGILLCIASLQEKPNRVFAWILLPLLCIWAVLTHPRAITFAMGAVAALTVIFWNRKKAALPILAVGIVLIGVGAYLLMKSPSDVGTDHLNGQFSHLLSVDGIKALLGTMLSHFSYLFFATYSVIAVALWQAIRSLKREEKGRGAVVFLLVTFVALWGLSSFYMDHHAKAIHILYGRYLDVTLPPMLLFLFANWKKSPRTVWLLGAAAVVLTGVFYAPATEGLDGGIMNSVGMFLYRTVMHYFRYWWAAAFFGAVSLIVLIAGKKRKNISILLLALLFLFQAGFMKQTYFEQEANVKREPSQILSFLPEHSKVLITDPQVPATWEYYHYAALRPDLTISEEDTGQKYLLSRTLRSDDALIAMEKNKPVYLYRRGGVAMLDYPQELSEYAVRYLWSKKGDGVKVSVLNQGSRPWLCYDAVHDLRAAVRLGVRQYDKAKTLISDERFDFSANVYPAEWQDFELTFYPDCVYAEIQPLVEFGSWFSDRGCEPLILRRSNKVLEEQIGNAPSSDHSFRRVEFAHLKYSPAAENTSYAGNLEGFYENWTGAESAIRNIRLPGGTGRLLIHTEDAEARSLSVTFNGEQTAEATRFSEGVYEVPFSDLEEITSLEFHSDTVNPFRHSGLPGWLSFLSLDSNLKPVQFAVHRLSAIMGRDVNNHDFGIRILTLEVKE